MTDVPIPRPSNESNSRTSAYEALSTLVAHAPTDCLPIISKLVIAVLDRSEQLFQMQVRCLVPCWSSLLD